MAKLVLPIAATLVSVFACCPGWAQQAAAPEARAAASSCRISSFKGTRHHPGRGTTYDIELTNIAHEPNGREFTGLLSYYGHRGATSSQPFKGRLLDDGSLRIDSRFTSPESDHNVRIRGRVEAGKFTGREGNYGNVTAEVRCAES